MILYIKRCKSIRAARRNIRLDERDRSTLWTGPGSASRQSAVQPQPLTALTAPHGRASHVKRHSHHRKSPHAICANPRDGGAPRSCTRGARQTAPCAVTSTQHASDHRRSSRTRIACSFLRINLPCGRLSRRRRGKFCGTRAASRRCRVPHRSPRYRRKSSP